MRWLGRGDNHHADMPAGDSAIDAIAALAMSCQRKSVRLKHGDDAGNIHAAKGTGKAAVVSSPIGE